jgi:hypothetical protein
MVIYPYIYGGLRAQAGVSMGMTLSVKTAKMDLCVSIGMSPLRWIRSLSVLGNSCADDQGHDEQWRGYTEHFAIH